MRLFTLLGVVVVVVSCVLSSPRPMLWRTRESEGEDRVKDEIGALQKNVHLHQDKRGLFSASSGKCPLNRLYFKSNR